VSLAYQLRHTLGLSDRDVAVLDRTATIALMQQYWSKPAPPT
jgi:hypothetical protein